MSGGRWEYAGFRLARDLARIGEDEEVIRRWPQLAGVFRGLTRWVYQVEHEMDWDLSCDSAIEDDATFDIRAAGALLDIVLRVLSDDAFPRGKWALIQEFQRRTGSEDSVAFGDIPAPGEPPW